MASRLLIAIVGCCCAQVILGSQGCRGSGACMAEDRLDVSSALQTVRGPGSSTAATQSPPAAALAAASPTFGFFFPVYKQEAATLLVVRSVRKFYPDSPIHLLQDGADVDFGQVCKLPRYNCTFEAMAGVNGPRNPHPWLLRFWNAAKHLNTDYIIYLEPDVEIRWRHTIQPPHDAGGMYDSYNHEMKPATAYYFERLGREVNPCFTLQWLHFGLAGGSYFRTAAILDAFAPEMVARIDWDGISQVEGGRTMASDFAMYAALSSRGFTVYPWKDVGEASMPKRYHAYNPEAAFHHGHKEHYNDTVGVEEQQLLSTPLKPRGDTNCKGCVWYSGEHLDKRLPVPSAAPPPVDPAGAYDPSKSEKDRLPPPDASKCMGRS